MIGMLLRLLGTVLAGVALILVLVGGQTHTALVCVTGGSTAIGLGTLIP